jgi:hypothetical protein
MTRRDGPAPGGRAVRAARADVATGTARTGDRRPGRPRSDGSTTAGRRVPEGRTGQIIHTGTTGRTPGPSWPMVRRREPMSVRTHDGGTGPARPAGWKEEVA